MKKGKQNRLRIILGLIGVIGVLIVHFFGGQLGMIGHMAPGIVSAHSWHRAVEEPQRYDAYSAYGVLGDRGSLVARGTALGHLGSDDDYLWMNAAHYLGVKSVTPRRFRTLSRRCVTGRRWPKKSEDSYSGS